MAKSYFAILGVSSAATPEEIRSAYRRLAKQYHPDRFAGDSASFREIQEAYHFLGDARRRRTYVQSLEGRPVNPSGRSGYPSPEPLVPDQRPVDPIGPFHNAAPSFDEFFEWLWEDF